MSLKFINVYILDAVNVLVLYMSDAIIIYENVF